LGFISFSDNAATAPSSICFRPDGFGLLVGCSDGRIAEVDLNKVAPGGVMEKGSVGVFHGDSYELTLPMEWHVFRRPKKNMFANDNASSNSSPKTQDNGSVADNGSVSPARNDTGSVASNLFPEGELGLDELELDKEEPLPPVLHVLYLLNHKNEESLASDSNNDNIPQAASASSAPDLLSPKVSFSNLPTDNNNNNASSSSMITKKKRSANSRFLVSFGGDLAGRMYECKFGEEEIVDTFSLGNLSNATKSNISEFTPSSSCLKYSSSNQFLLSGATDGSVTIRQSGQTGERNDPLEWCYLRLQPHDGDSSVRAVSLSYDNKFLLSAGDDGHMIVHRIKCGGIEPLALAGVVEHRRRGTCVANNIPYSPLPENAAITLSIPRSLLPAPVPISKIKAVADDDEASKDKSEEGGGAENASAAAAAVTTEEVAVTAARLPSVAFGVAIGGKEGDIGPVPFGFDEVPSAIQSELANPNKKAKDKVIPEVVDIKDAKAYTIQDAKLKTDEDQRKLDAEIKKKEVLQQVAQLQKEFEELVAANEELPPEQMLSEDDLLVDPELAAILNEKGNEMIEEVHKECAYATEKSERRLMKLGDRFLDPVITEHCSLSTFNLVGTTFANSGAGSRGEVSCSNFVVNRPSETLVNLLESIGLEMRAEQASLRASLNNDPRLRHQQSMDKEGSGNGSQVSLQGSESSFYGFNDDMSTDSQKEKVAI
jgi:hypothetical protein